ETGAVRDDSYVVRNGWSGPQLDLDTEDADTPMPEFEGWVSNEIGHRLFEIGGLDPQLIEEAKKPGFKAVPMNVTTGVKITNTFRRATSNNVIAKIDGT